MTTLTEVILAALKSKIDFNNVSAPLKTASESLVNNVFDTVKYKKIILSKFDPQKQTEVQFINGWMADALFLAQVGNPGSRAKTQAEKDAAIARRTKDGKKISETRNRWNLKATLAELNKEASTDNYMTQSQFLAMSQVLIYQARSLLKIGSSMSIDLETQAKYPRYKLKAEYENTYYSSIVQEMYAEDYAIWSAQFSYRLDQSETKDFGTKLQSARNIRKNALADNELVKWNLILAAAVGGEVYTMISQTPAYMEMLKVPEVANVVNQITALKKP